MKRYRWLILLAFGMGILAVNLIGKEKICPCEILSRYYLIQDAYQVTVQWRFLAYVLLERVKMILLCVLLAKVFGKQVLRYVATGLVAVLLGLLFTVSFWNLGIAGIVIILCAGIPHWGCYLLALYSYTAQREMRFKIMYVAAAVCLAGLGIFAESYINPRLMRIVLEKIY